MIFDASIIRNFALMDRMDILVALSPSRIRIVHGVIAHPGEASDLGGICEAFQREMLKEQSGSPRYGRYITAVSNLEALLHGHPACEVLMPSYRAQVRAVELHEASRERRVELGIRRRRLALSDAVSITVALEYDEALATDDEDAAAAYVRLGGQEHVWTRDLLDRAIAEGLLAEDAARRGYTMLVEDESFYAPAWDAR